jgi:hypothetical protein
VVRIEPGAHDASSVVLLAIPHRIVDKQAAIEVDGVGKSLPETPNSWR